MFTKEKTKPKTSDKGASTAEQLVEMVMVQAAEIAELQTAVAEAQARIVRLDRLTDALKLDSFRSDRIHGRESAVHCWISSKCANCGEKIGAIVPRSQQVPSRGARLIEPGFDRCCGLGATSWQCYKKKCPRAREYGIGEIKSWAGRYWKINEDTFKAHPELESLARDRVKELRQAQWIP